MYSNQVISKVELDQEWLHLITEAKNAGLTLNEIRDFLGQETATEGMKVNYKEIKVLKHSATS